MMEEIGLELFACAFLILTEIIFIPSSSILFYAHIYDADLSEMRRYIEQTRYLKHTFGFRKVRKTYDIMGFSTKGHLDSTRKRQRILSAIVGLFLPFVAIFLVFAIAFRGMIDDFGTWQFFIHAGIFVIQMVVAIRLLLIGRDMKSFVKHKDKSKA